MIENYYIPVHLSKEDIYCTFCIKNKQKADFRKMGKFGDFFRKFDGEILEKLTI